MGGEGLISLESHPGIPPLQQLLLAAQLQVEVIPDINRLVWGKLVISSAINPLTAILGVPNGVLLERPGARLLMEALARETARVAAALGIRLPFSNPLSAVEEVARRTAANHSSMFQDVQRGARTEIDAICGAVVRAGQTQGIDAPVNWSMWQLVSALNPG
jgi:2-dehydropantoate 2-reductase